MDESIEVPKDASRFFAKAPDGGYVYNGGGDEVQLPKSSVIEPGVEYTITRSQNTENVGAFNGKLIRVEAVGNSGDFRYQFSVDDTTQTFITRDGVNFRPQGKLVPGGVEITIKLSNTSNLKGSALNSK
jgi:hypothetical protein